MEDAPYIIAAAFLLITSITAWAIWMDYKDTCEGKQ